MNVLEIVVDRYDKQVHRLLEISLGLFTWSVLTSPIWMGILYPPAIVYLLTFFTVYWSYLAVKHWLGLTFGYNRYTREMKTDWMAQCNKLDFSVLPDRNTLPKSLGDVRHLLLIPAVDESEIVLKNSLDSVLDQTFPTRQITVVYTVEQKYAEEVIARVKHVLEGKGHLFNKILFYVHPSGISGEAVGVAGANRTWGASHAVEDLRQDGENLRNYIFDSIDADHVLDRQYLARVTHLYLTSDNRDSHYYTTAVHLFNNNLWDVPTIMRIEANAVTLGTLSCWGTVKKAAAMDTFAAYSASLQTLIDANYWDVSLGVDDTIFYWRAFFTRNGNFDGVPHFIPYSADAVMGKNYIDSYASLYKQLLRWGWGAIDFPLSVKEFLKNRRIKFSKKLMWMIMHFKKRVVLVTIVFLITFGFGIVTLVNPLVKQTNFAYSLPHIMSTILTCTLVFLVPGTLYRLKLARPMPKEWPLYRKFIAYLEGPLIILNLLTFSFFPFLEAQTRMLLGKRMKDLYFTPKIR